MIGEKNAMAAMELYDIRTKLYALSECVHGFDPRAVHAANTQAFLGREIAGCAAEVHRIMNRVLGRPEDADDEDNEDAAEEGGAS
ncbi:MAG: hypothetical protein AB7S71_18260 [Dongiaceae bacterium]